MIYYRDSRGKIRTLGDDELMHWKYIKKIKVGSGFRYFYDQDELRAFYDKGKDDVQKNVRKVTNKRDRFKSRFTKESKKATKELKGRIVAGKSWFDRKDDKKNKDTKEKEPDYKYIEKITVNGKTRYFYSEEELEAYRKREEYRKNEPDFMKKFKKSEDPYTAEEDAILVNPKVDSFNTDYQTNCAECTAIYELRRRGYDVESNGVSGEPNSLIWWKKDYIETSQANKYNTDLRYEEFYKNPKIQEVKVPPFTSDEDYAKAIRKEIQKNPPGSRGDLSVQWFPTGGHSMVWEVDSKGKAHVYDSQTSGKGTRIEYDIDEMSKHVAHQAEDPSGKKYYTQVVRTDNLELNEGITKICKNTSDRKKGVSDKKISNPTLVEYRETEWDDEELKTKYPILSEEGRKRR